MSRDEAIDILKNPNEEYHASDGTVGYTFYPNKKNFEAFQMVINALEQWQELKETITELRDSGGKGTQEEICGYLVNYMNVLESGGTLKQEKQELKQESCKDCISREKAKQFLYERIDRLNDDELYDIFSRIIDDMYNELPSVTPTQKPYEKFESTKDHIFKLAGDYKCWDNRLTDDEALELCHILEQESVLDKIRAEIENHCCLIKENHCKYCSSCNCLIGVREILETIDKYKESEDGE